MMDSPMANVPHGQLTTDLCGWEVVDSGGGPFWSKSILSGSSGIPFMVVCVKVEGVDKYVLGMAGFCGALAERDSLEACQILAHETARLWEGRGACGALGIGMDRTERTDRTDG